MASSFRNYEKDFYRRKIEMNKGGGGAFQDISLASSTSSRTKSKSKPKMNNSKDKRFSPYNNRTVKLSKDNKSPYQKNNVVNNYGNININVNNLIISNQTNGQQNTPSTVYSNNNNYQAYPSSSGSVFSKLGYDIIGKKKKGTNSFSVMNQMHSTDRQKQLQNNKIINTPDNNNINNKEPNKVESIFNQNVMQNMINDLMEITKNQEKNELVNLNNNTNDKKKLDNLDTNEINVDTLNVNLSPNSLLDSPTKRTKSNLIDDNNNITTFNGKQKIVIENDSDILFNSFLWEKVLYFEIHSDSKQNLSMAEHSLLNEIITKLENKQINFCIFNNNGLNNSYSRTMKVLFIILIYLKFILLDFNYDITLKSQIKKMLNAFNGNLLTILNTFVVVDEAKENPDSQNLVFSKDFNETYNKSQKFHKAKKIVQQNVNIQQFVANYNKSLDLTIATMKAISNTYFKIGYFKPLHTVIIDLFRNIDTISSFNFANLLVNHILFYVINNHLNDKQKETVSNKAIIFNPTNLLSLYGLNIGTVPAPFLPAAPESTYTLVLDLDETLVHFFYTPSGGTFLIRPHCFEFLQQMSELYDIAIFTAAMKEYADGILNLIDKDKKYIKYRLYRQHTSINGMCFVKDLSKIGRDLRKVIIIDNLCDNFKLQPNNGLGIRTWTEEIRDTQLIDMGNLLKEIAEKKPTDVRPIIKKIKEETNKRMRKNIINPYKNLSIDKL